MGAGLKTIDSHGYLTDRTTYREVDTNDTDVDAIEEVLDTRVDASGNPVVNGHRQTIALFVLPEDGETCNVTLYGRSNDESQEESASSSSPSGVTEWSAYDTQTGIGNKMLVYTDMPAGEYKVMVTAISDGAVIIREAHST